VLVGTLRLWNVFVRAKEFMVNGNDSYKGGSEQAAAPHETSVPD